MTLDPQTPQDWQALRTLSHRIVDDVLEFTQTLRDRKVWRPLPAAARAGIASGLPRKGRGAEAAYAACAEHVLPFPTGNVHPRFWGWVMSPGTPIAALSEMVAATMNPHLAGYDDAASAVEDEVLRWMKELFCFPAQAGGLLVSGGSMANLVGLIVARNARAGVDVREEGVAAMGQVGIYASRETHVCVQRAVEVMGLGRRSLRLLPVDENDRLDLQALRHAIGEDRRRGVRPLCLVGNAGTVSTGAVDDLEALSAVAREEELWFHVDGALGAPAVLAPNLRPLLRGLERADSLALDLHKWLQVPYEAGCILVRDEAAQRAAFAYEADYLVRFTRGLAARSPRFADYGIELSRGFKALKIWMAFQTYGVEGLAQVIETNAAQAQRLAQRVDAEATLERLAPVVLNVVCFRYRPAGLTPARLDEINREILTRLHEEGVAVPSSARLRGGFALRVCITNHRTRDEDLDLLVREVLRLGSAVAGTS